MDPKDQSSLGDSSGGDSSKPLEASSKFEDAPAFPAPPPSGSFNDFSSSESGKKIKDEKISDPFSGKNEGEYFKVKNEKEPKKDSGGETLEQHDFARYAKQNKEAVTTYVLLVIGILLLIFDAFLLGSLIIGLIAGYHFSHEIVFYLRNLTQIFAGQEQVRYIVLTAVVVALFIAIPGIFIGALVAAVFKQVILGNRDMA